MVEINFLDIFNIIKALLAEKNQVGVAARLGITGAAITEAKKRDSIPEGWYEKVEQLTGVDKQQIIANAQQLKKERTIHAAQRLEYGLAPQYGLPP